MQKTKLSLPLTTYGNNGNLRLMTNITVRKMLFQDSDSNLFKFKNPWLQSVIRINPLIHQMIFLSHFGKLINGLFPYLLSTGY